MKIVIIGGGIAGCAAAILIKRTKGLGEVDIEIYEQQEETYGGEGGRSLNITLCDRGWSVIQDMGCESTLKNVSMKMTHRAVHTPDGTTNLSSYDVHNHQNGLWAIPRSVFVATLRELARDSGAVFHYGKKFVSFDKTFTKAWFGPSTGLNDASVSTLPTTTTEADLFIGADGSFSGVRTVVQKQSKGDFRITHSPYEYTELDIISSTLSNEAFHTWPTNVESNKSIKNNNNRMLLLAMPNKKAHSFSGSLFFPREDSDAVMHDPAEWVKRHFPIQVDSIKCHAKVAGSMIVASCTKYHHSKVVLIGDAAHAMVPFAGQGANSALEDCRELVKVLKDQLQHGGTNFDFDTYYRNRKAHVDAISRFAEGNFEAMRRLDSNPYSQLHKTVLTKIYNVAPSVYSPPHVDINFSLKPYAQVISKSYKQDFLLQLFFVGASVLILFYFLGKITGVAGN